MASGSDENGQILKIGANIEASTVHYSGTINIKNKDDGLLAVGTNIRAQTVNIENPSNLNIEEFDLPPLIKPFKGRDKYLQKLDTLFFQENETKVVICGLPGYGKSELSKQFANSCLLNEKISKAFWIKSGNKDELRRASSSLKKIYKTYKEERCLFVFENGISRQSITEYEPPDNDNFKLLITSQEKDWGDDVIAVKLEPLSSQSAIDVYKAVLCNNFKQDKYDLYVDLAAVVGNVPLGLQITAGYMRQEMRALKHEFQLGEYVEAIKQSIKEIINKKIPRCTANSYEKSIYGAMKVSLGKIQEEEDIELRDLAIYALYLCSFLDPEKIGVEDLLIMIRTNDTLAQITYIERKYKLALSLLDNFLFVDVIHLEYLYDFVKIHRLTQDILRIHINEYDLQLQTDCYTMCLHYLFNFSTYFSHANLSPILRHADDNLVTVNHFSSILVDGYKFQSFLGRLVEFGCINSLKYILEKNDKSINEHIQELLRQAVFHSQHDCLKFLLQQGDFDINLGCYQLNYTLLHEAAWKCNLVAIKILITEYSADTSAKDRFGNTPLFTFVNNYFNETIDWIEILDLFKFEKDTTNNNEETLLHLSAANSPENLLDLLINKYSMNVNQQDVKGRTPLHMLPLPNDKNVNKEMAKIKLLLKHGASLDIKDEDYNLSSYNVVRYARKSEDSEMLEWLQQQGVNMDITNRTTQDQVKK